MATEMVRIKVVDPGGIKATDRATGIHHSLHEGDTVTVSQPAAERWCGFGWAEDVEGKIPTGERKPGAQGKLTAAKATQESKGV